MSSCKWSVRLVTLLITLLVTALGAYAQYRAGIQGTVLDPQGGVVAGAKVAVTAKETGFSQETTTDASGVFGVNRLAPGLYDVLVEKAGFRKQVVADVNVAAEQMTSLNVTLEVGKVTESVTVNGADLPAIDTESGNIADTLNSQEIQILPSFGRDPFQLTRLAPGIFGDGATNGDGGGRGMPGSNQSGSGSTGSIFMTENQPQIVAGGTRNNGNSYQVDGVEVNSLAWGGSAVITPNEEAVKEVQVQASPYSAENGRNSGAQVLVVTKNGTNEFHGSAFLKIHRPGLDAFQRWGGPYGGAPQRDINRFNQIGGSVGGPILKNRLFFFFSYETLRNTVSGPGPGGWYETPQFDTLISSAVPNTYIAPQYTGFAGTAIQYTAINQVTCADVNLPSTQCATVYSGGKIAGLNVGSPMTGATRGAQDPTYGLAATPYGVGGGLDPTTPDVFFVTTFQHNKQVATQWNGRMDYQVTNRDLVAYSIFWVPNNNDDFYNGAPRGANLWNSDRLNYAMTTFWDHTFTPTLVNEARFNATRWWFDEVKSNPQVPFGFPDDGINGMGNVGGWPWCCSLFGPPGPGVFYQTTYNIRDTLTKVHSSHSLKFGTDIYKEQDNDVTTWAGVPGYTFNNLWDFANDAPISESGSFDPRTGRPTSSYKHIRSNIYAFFAQDDWKAKPNLTLNFGLRWEYFGPIHEKQNNLSTVILGQGTNALTDLRVRVGGNMYNSSHNNWGPQLGFAWSPKGVLGREFNNRFVVRGGAGIAYNRLQEAITLNGRFNPPLVVNPFLTGSNILYALADKPSDIYGFPSNPAAIQTFDPTTGLPTCAPATCAPVSLTAFDLNMPTPTVFRYSVEGQYDLGSRWVATVGYQGTQSRHFTRQITNLNYLYLNNLNPAVGSVDLYTNDANAGYNALLTRIEHRFARNFQVDAQYTYSSCMDHGSQDYYADPYPFNVNASLGHCDFDATNSFKAVGIWSPRIFRGQQNWMEKVLGGWQFSGIYTYHTGFPFSPYYHVNVNYPSGSGIGTCSLVVPNSGFCQVEPAAYTGGASQGHSNSIFEQAFGSFPQLALNPQAYFTLPTLSATGIPPAPGIQRNLFRGPRYLDLDFTAGKDFGLPNMKIIGENAKLSVHANFYNLFNTLNLSPISGPQHLGDINFDTATSSITSVVVDPSFGRSSGALGARVVEFQFRFQF